MLALSIVSPGAAADGAWVDYVTADVFFFEQLQLVFPGVYFVPPQDTGKKKGKYEDQWRDTRGDATHDDPVQSPLIAGQPDNVQTRYELSDDGEGYYVYEEVGGEPIGPPSYITRAQYQELHDQQTRRQGFENLAVGRKSESTGAASNELIPDINVDSKLFETIFGSTKIDIKPNVSVLLDLSIRRNVMQNPRLTRQQQRNTSFNFDQQIQMNVVGQIGEKLRLNTNYDTEAAFQFENKFKVDYAGEEDDIIKKIEAGNVSLPVNGSLINGGQNLMGVKVTTQWGPVFVTTVASLQRGKTNEITVKNGGQQTNFEKKASDYDYNRHFFLTHYFRSEYERSLANLPQVNSPINITRLEVWVTNRNATATNNNRNALGFVDLGEHPQTEGRIWNEAYVQPNASPTFPDNQANNLYQKLRNNSQTRSRNTAVNYLKTTEGLEDGIDFQLQENMRLLNQNEYTLNPQLGYVSLNTRLGESDVLFVAFEYTVAGSDEVFSVGEFSQDQPSNERNSNLLFLKMVKPQNIRPTWPDPQTGEDAPYPTWDLMMKNVYNIGGFNLRQEGFDMQIVYQATDGSGDINYLPTSPVQNTPLLQVFEADNLTNNMERGPDNIYDFIPGITVLPDKGTLIFPVLEPFGSTLAEKTGPDSAQYVFEALYSETQADAINYSPELDRFMLVGNYTGASSSEIYLNSVQVSEGSVTVTAGGTQLQEGSDYTVDYQIGKVSILNEGILRSGQDITIRFESNDLFGVDQKTLVGVRVDYRRYEDWTVGGTMIHLNERPVINKVTLGEEPVSNLIWGVDGRVQKDSRFLTQMVDLLPFHDTKTTSNVNFQAEFAQLIPGSPRQIKISGDQGVAFLDDFEGTRSTVQLNNQLFWKLSSRPEKLRSGFTADEPLSGGYRRAKLAWYQVDPAFYDRSQLFGLDEQAASLNNPYYRRVYPLEVFPQRDFVGLNVLSTLDIHYYPSERGPYNYESNPSVVRPDGSFRNPSNMWAGIMRRTTGNTDFEAANFEFIEFWVMDPFLEGSPDSTGTGGDVFLNLGKISEDVLPDTRRSFENGLPTGADASNENQNLSTTPWARVSDEQIVNNAFDNTGGSRPYQDVGLDGLASPPINNAPVNNPGPDDLAVTEETYFSVFLDEAANVLDPGAINTLRADPSSDDYAHFTDFEEGTDIERRYKDFNGPDGNAPVNEDGATFTRTGDPNPDVEDINADGTLNTQESYWEYKISMREQDLVVGQNYVVDRRDTVVRGADGSEQPSVWYQFRVPLDDGIPVNNISNFKAIDFIRMYLTNFTNEIILRFGKFELVSTQWRIDDDEYRPVGEGCIGCGDEGEDNPTTEEPTQSSLEIGTVNVEENGSKDPYNYKLPPGIERQQQLGAGGGGAQGQLRMNEQALVMRVRELTDGASRGVFRRFNHDLRFYKNLKLWMHTEPLTDCANNGNVSECGDINAVVRIGSDYTNNYYEYELPLCPPPASAGIGNISNKDLWQNIEVQLQELNRVKQIRNDRGISRRQPFEEVQEDGSIIRIVGTPQLNQSKVVWIGVKNPETGNGMPVCAEMWVNELRVTDFNQQSSWAANARMNLKLADFATIQASISRQTPYFGGVQQKVSERSFEDIFRYDVAANIAAEKLLPKAVPMEIPVYVTYGEKIIRPEFNPLEPDIRLDQTLEAQENDSAREAKLEQSIDYERVYSYSFNNVRFLPNQDKKQSWPWDLSNFSFSYGYNDRFHRNAQIESHRIQNWTGGINYNYAIQSKPFEPFKKLLQGRNPISAINLYYLPRNITVRISADRHYERKQLRSVSNSAEIDPVYFQNFMIRREYALQWNLTRSINFQYSATSNARVDEPRGDLATDAEQDTLARNILSFGRNEDYPYPDYHRINFGRTLNFQQSANATYQLPFSTIEPLNWVNTSLNYQSTYQWQSASLDNLRFGNTVQNNRTFTVNSQLNLGRFYNGFPIIKEVLKPIPKKNVISKEDSSREEGDDIKVGLSRVGKFFAGMLFSVQDISGNYSINQSTLLTGYLPRHDNLGVDWDYTSDSTGVTSNALGLPFAFGDQPALRSREWFEDATRKGYFTTNERFATPFQQQDARNFTLRTSIELFKGFRVDVNFTKNTSETYSALWAVNDQDEFVLSNRAIQGNMTMSFLSIGTAFEGFDGSPAFDAMDETLRREAAFRLRDQNPDFYRTTLGDSAGVLRTNNRSTNEYPNGLTGSQQNVMMPAFLAAYGPYDINSMELSAFQKLPYPNWQVNYNGLNSIDALRDIFQTVTIRHGYRSTYTVNYLLNVNSIRNGRLPNGDISEVPQEIADNRGAIRGGTPGDSVGVANLEPVYNITQATITEAFAPLIGVNFNFKNGIGAQIDFKKNRTVVMNVGALQINETKNTEFTMNLSWRRESFMDPITLFGRTIDLRNQITFRFETTFRNSRIQNRRLDSENEPEPTGGTWNLTIKPSVDYQINSQLSVRAYVEYNNNRPVLSTSFPSRYTAVGVQVRFNLNSTMAGAQLPGGGGGGQMPGGGQRGGGQPGGGRRGQ